MQRSLTTLPLKPKATQIKHFYFEKVTNQQITDIHILRIHDHENNVYNKYSSGFYTEFGSGGRCHPEDESCTFLPNV